MGTKLRSNFKLNDRVRKRVCDAIRRGNYVINAVKLAGITQVTHYTWTARGQKELESRAAGNEPDDFEAPYYKYFLAIERAKAEAEDIIVEAWTDQIPEDWRAAKEFLARRYPERWGSKDEVTVHTPDLAGAYEELLKRAYGDGSGDGEDDV